jgi:hypothetical protein
MATCRSTGAGVWPDACGRSESRVARDQTSLLRSTAPADNPAIIRGVQMARTGQPRTTQTKDLSATLRFAGSTRVVDEVLNLSEGGMLLASSDLDVGETTHFELEGPGFQFAGLATVAHRTGQATGLRFLSWEGPAYRPLCLLIAARLRGPVTSDHAGARDPRVPRRVAALIAGQRTLDRAAAAGRRRSS